ncbi:MAG: transposase [Planktothrix sp.]
MRRLIWLLTRLCLDLKGLLGFNEGKEYPHLKKIPSEGTRSYFCGTVGNASEETVKKYIQNQNT